MELLLKSSNSISIDAVFFCIIPSGSRLISEYSRISATESSIRAGRCVGETILLPDKLRQTLEVNLVGTADFTEKMLPNLSKDAHIVFVSSEAGSITLTEEGISHEPGYYPAYKISKAALNMYMATLADRTMKEGLIVSAVHPGWVRTNMGGDEAPMIPEEAADDIFKLAVSRPQTGGFWFKGKREPW